MQGANLESCGCVRNPDLLGSQAWQKFCVFICFYLSFLKKKIEDFERQDGKHDETWNDGVLFFQKKSPRVGFFTTPILVGGPTQATTAARQQFKVDKIKGINDMKCHAML